MSCDDDGMQALTLRPLLTGCPIKSFTDGPTSYNSVFVTSVAYMYTCMCQNLVKQFWTQISSEYFAI